MAQPAATPWKEDSSLAGFRRTLEPDGLCGVRPVSHFEGMGGCSDRRHITGLAILGPKMVIRDGSPGGFGERSPLSTERHGVCLQTAILPGGACATGMPIPRASPELLDAPRDSPSKRKPIQ